MTLRGSLVGGDVVGGETQTSVSALLPLGPMALVCLRILWLSVRTCYSCGFVSDASGDDCRADRSLASQHPARDGKWQSLECGFPSWRRDMFGLLFSWPV